MTPGEGLDGIVPPHFFSKAIWIGPPQAFLYTGGKDLTDRAREANWTFSQACDNAEADDDPSPQDCCLRKHSEWWHKPRLSATATAIVDPTETAIDLIADVLDLNDKAFEPPTLQAGPKAPGVYFPTQAVGIVRKRTAPQLASSQRTKTHNNSNGCLSTADLGIINKPTCLAPEQVDLKRSKFYAAAFRGWAAHSTGFSTPNPSDGMVPQNHHQRHTYQSEED